MLFKLQPVKWIKHDFLRVLERIKTKGKLEWPCVTVFE